MNREGPEGAGGDVDCTTAIDQLYHYLDGELTEQRRLQIAEHLEYCGPCAGAAEFEAELRQVIADRCRDRVPDALRERIAALIEDERRRHGMASGVEGVP
jgi:mycothiol system anti-sigma-R factor